MNVAATSTASKRAATQQATTAAPARGRGATPAAGGMAARKPGAGASSQGAAEAKRSTPGHITPEQALDNTRQLLAAKQAKARKSPRWQAHAEVPGGVPKPGFESESARDKALELHQGEMHLEAIEGSISDRDRRQQGKRDSR